MKFVIYNLRDYDEKAFLDQWCSEYGISYISTPEAPNMENAELARGIDAISIITSPTPKELLDKFYEMGVRYIMTRSIGYDHIDVAHARKLGIRISNVRYSPDSVANYAIMLMLIACRKYDHILQRGDLQDYTLKGCIGREFSKCTVGIIGTGKIGSTVIRHLTGFGVKILAYDPKPNPEVADIAQYMELNELLEASDIISLHVPGLPSLEHMIGAEEFDRMKPGVIIVNTARGLLIDEDALIDNLESGKVGYAALDTVEHEGGLYYNDKKGVLLGDRNLAILKSLPNVTVTPHMAFYTDLAVSGMIGSTVKSLMAFRSGEDNPYEVK